MSSSRETESSKDLFEVEEEDSVIHQIYEKAPNDELISTTKSTYSNASRKGAEILQGITKSSMKKFVGPSHSSFRTDHKNFRFKSQCPHVSLKCAFFENLDKGWLLRRFDASAGNSILFSNFATMSILNYDIKNYKFGLESDVLELKDDFFGVFTRLNGLSDHLVCFSTFKN